MNDPILLSTSHLWTDDETIVIVRCFQSCKTCSVTHEHMNKTSPPILYLIFFRVPVATCLHHLAFLESQRTCLITGSQCLTAKNKESYVQIESCNENLLLPTWCCCHRGRAEFWMLQQLKITYCNVWLMCLHWLGQVPISNNAGTFSISLMTVYIFSHHVSWNIPWWLNFSDTYWVCVLCHTPQFRISWMMVTNQ